MNVLIKEVTLIDPGSPASGSVHDVLISEGMIAKIALAGTLRESTGKTLDGKGKYLSPGWFDLHVNFREPGFEYKEDLQSGCRAAMQGGFTGVLMMPSTYPPVHSKSQVEFIRTRTQNELVDVFPAGTVSHNQEGKDLSEMYDMHCSGALAFTDDKKSIQDSGLMTRAMHYVQNFNGRLLVYAEDKAISAKGQMNEGISSTMLGLKGIPSVAEEVMINRDLYLAEYTGTPVHFSTISTRPAVELIRAARKKGLKVTADVSVMHLSYDDSVLQEFDTVYKIKPPLRTSDDIRALVEGLKDGTIDAICSDHIPEDPENKIKEFDLASFGAAGIETAFAAAHTALQKFIPLERLIHKFTSGPRSILGLPNPLVKEGETANLTFFDAHKVWTVRESDLKSKSRNNPFLGKELTGKALAVFNNGSVSFSE